MESMRRSGVSRSRCNFCINAIKAIPVLLIVSIIAWSYYAYVVQLCFYAVDSILERTFYLVAYHFFLFFFLWAYWQTVFTPIAKVPSKFRLPYAELEKIEAAENDAAQRQILENFARTLPVYNRTVHGMVRFCEKCQLVKPDRAHHCGVCGTCVLKMDHHCPWVNNCVSFSNYKYFNLFLAYALLYCLFIAVTTVQYFVKFWRGEGNKEMGKFNIVFLFFVAVMFAVSLMSLFGYHCYLVLHNRSTLEAFRAPIFSTGADKNGFSLGAYNNFQEVFGDNRLTWFLPVFTRLEEMGDVVCVCYSRGDGTEFPLRPQQLQVYQSMGTTDSLGDGVTFPHRLEDEAMSSLLGNSWQDDEFHPPPFSEQARSLVDPSPV